MIACLIGRYCALWCARRPGASPADKNIAALQLSTAQTTSPTPSPAGTLLTVPTTAQHRATTAQGWLLRSLPLKVKLVENRNMPV